MRPYEDGRDYPVILAAVKACGEMSLRAVAEALTAAGIIWPKRFATHNDDNAREIDRGIIRAWRECGLTR